MMDSVRIYSGLLGAICAAFMFIHTGYSIFRHVLNVGFIEFLTSPWAIKYALFCLLWAVICLILFYSYRKALDLKG